MTLDLAEFRELNGVTGNTGRCGAAVFVATLDEEECAQLDAAFADPTIQTSAIHRWMEKRGYQLQANTVRRHRKGECPCGRRG